MQVRSHKTKLCLLAHYVDQWRIRAGSRETVAVAIVETHIAFGFNTRAKLVFDTNGDAFTLAKNAADRIFRWLDDKTKDNNFMPPNFEDSILLAMPDDLRLAYLNEWLGIFDMRATGADVDRAAGTLMQHFKSVTRESSEAMSALADLPDDACDKQLADTDKELAESLEAIHRARAFIHAKRGLKAVA